MDEYISIDKLIKQAKSKGVNFGSGDPYNRLRYYTKIGWLSHMVRKADKKGNIKGHYPAWSVDRLILIENLKSEGYTNEEISEKLKTKNKIESFLMAVSSPEIRKQVVIYLTLIAVSITLASELGFIHLGKSKSQIMTVSDISQQTQIIQNGTSFVPKNQSKVFITAEGIKANSKVYVSFNQDYTPASRYWVSQIKPQEGFELTLDTPVSYNSEFSWWLTQ
ncbi:MerR family transcriptional regulator [candidate division WWE3 bacterium]|uniref:MerR family transcriptional regulator n=1 Tax=candidate division WWE3 bacterium TaxID=2053526 RepID=A0A7X9E7K0_UNCKA|nr:MerR family transcriptional regulator [candidate division WWE3 bacterium]